MSEANRLSNGEIMKLVNRYIGVSGGYLGDFSYRTHHDFYLEYCEIDIDPYQIEGTTRERFITILSSLPGADQAKVVRGVLERFPVGDGPDSRNQELANEFLRLAERLENPHQVSGRTLAITTEVVSRAIRDAEQLVRTSGATSGVDRIHTALHGYLLAVCNEVGITYPADASTTVLFKRMRSEHPRLRDLGCRSQEIERVLFAFSTILDALNPLRNRASVAHPNEALLEEAEAMLVINVGRTLLNYLDARLS